MATTCTRAKIARKRAEKTQKRKANAKTTKAKAAELNSARAQKRKAFVKTIKAKAVENIANASMDNFSNQKTNEMVQQNTIGIMVKVKTKSGLDNFIAFETDNEEFLPIYNEISKRDHLEILEYIWGADIINHFEKQLQPDFDFSMIVLQFLCTTNIRKCIANNGGASFGVIVNFDETKYLASVDLFPYDEWKAILDIKNKEKGARIINK